MYNPEDYKIHNPEYEELQQIIDEESKKIAIDDCGQDYIHYSAGFAFVILSAWLNSIMLMLRNAGMYIRMPFPTTFALIVISMAWAVFALINQKKAFSYYEKFFKYTLPAILLMFIVFFPFVLIFIFSQIQKLLIG